MSEVIMVSIKDACTFLSVGRTTMYKLMNEGRVGFVKLGKRTLIPKAELHSLVEELLEEATAERQPA